MKNRITRDQIIEKMKEGWEFGLSGSMSSRFWIQKKLCCNGESVDVQASTARAMIKAGIIREIKPRPTDAYWLVRFELTPTNNLTRV